MNFLRNNAKWLAAPFLLTFASGFGQTFFIALFGEAIRDEFSLSHSAWGSIYATGTLISAAAMIRFGGIVDKTNPQNMAKWIFLAFFSFAILMAINPFYWFLPFVIFGLRFCGQGMLTHLSMVVTGRWFNKNRGKAIAITSLGFSFAEAIFPIIFVFFIATIGWRPSWMVAAFLLAIFGLLITKNLTKTRDPIHSKMDETSHGMNSRSWTRKEMLRNWVFWVSFPAFFAVPFFSTTFFFQLPHLANIKQWELTDLAIRMPFYTASSVLGLLVAGSLIDRFQSRRVMAFALLPMIVGYILISYTNSIQMALPAMMLMGMSQGANSALAGVFWPDFYGTKHLGEIRSVATGSMVFATALGPAISGYLIDQGIGFEFQLRLMAAYSMLAVFTLLMVGLSTRKSFSS